HHLTPTLFPYTTLFRSRKRHRRRFPSQRQLPPKSDRTYTFEFFGRFLSTIQSTGQLEYWCCASRWRPISSAVRLACRSIVQQILDRKSTRLNSSHVSIS